MTDENESDWLHRNDAYQMQKNARRIISANMPDGHNKSLIMQHSHISGHIILLIGHNKSLTMHNMEVQGMS